MMSISRILQTVLPALATMLPMQRDRMNWARKTMQETMAMSVPIPRTYMEEEMEEERFLKPIVKVLTKSLIVKYHLMVSMTSLICALSH